jgi:hypothetical protein
LCSASFPFSSSPWLTRQNLKQSHRIALLKVMRMVVVDKLDLISEDLGDKLATIGMAEMLAEKSV